MSEKFLLDIGGPVPIGTGYDETRNKSQLPLVDVLSEKVEVHSNQVVCAEFKEELNFAGNQAVAAMRKICTSVRGREKVLTAIDGMSSNERSCRSQMALLQLLSPFFLDRVEQPIPIFSKRPTFRVLDQETTGKSRPVLESDCTCAVSWSTSEIFVDQSFGFQDLVTVSHVSLCQYLVISAEDAGLAVEVDVALDALCNVLSCDPSRFLEAFQFEPTLVSCDGMQRQAVVTARGYDMSIDGT